VNQVIDPTGDEALDAIPVGDSGPARKVGLVLAWIGVAIVAVCAVWFVSAQLIGSDGGSVVEQYTSGKHVELYESLKDQFKVSLPTTPHRTEHDDASGRTVIVVSTPGPGYQFSVTRESQPGTALESYAETLNTAAGSLAQQVGAEIVTQSTPTPYGKVAVKDVVFRKGNEYYRATLLLTQDRLYTIQAKVKGSDPKPFQRLSRSFSILGPY
jgi:hypothetical protein